MAGGRKEWVRMTSKDQTVLKDPKNAKTVTTDKVATALEVRESAAKVRTGKPLAFPTRRMRP